MQQKSVYLAAAVVLIALQTVFCLRQKEAHMYDNHVYRLLTRGMHSMLMEDQTTQTVPFLHLPKAQQPLIEGLQLLSPRPQLQS